MHLRDEASLKEVMILTNILIKVLRSFSHNNESLTILKLAVHELRTNEILLVVNMKNWNSKIIDSN